LLLFSFAPPGRDSGSQAAVAGVADLSGTFIGTGYFREETAMTRRAWLFLQVAPLDPAVAKQAEIDLPVDAHCVRVVITGNESYVYEIRCCIAAERTGDRNERPRSIGSSDMDESPFGRERNGPSHSD
jgi:hypothetical protein